MSEERGHEDERHGPDPEAVGGPRHHQARQREVEPEAVRVEEAEAEAEHGRGRGAEEDHVDELTVQPREKKRRGQVAQGYQ